MSVKVAVRCRPLSTDEQDGEHTVVVRMKGNEVVVMNNSMGQGGRFSFDEALWSVADTQNSNEDRQYASQETVYKSVASDLIKHFVAGYNCCIFAYGQTGSGKTYSMIGTSADVGIIPRVAKDIFAEVNKLTNSRIQTCVEVSYFEIYNETVRCLLCPKEDDLTKPTLRVREHPKFGPFVEGLTKFLISTETELLQLLNEGNKFRAAGATAMNALSSRSHAIFAITLTQKETKGTLLTTKSSKLNLVDLAGSERASKAMATGKRFIEGTNINKSLTCLGNVISSLAEEQELKKARHIPYRDSLLTWVLKDNLGGNSKTVMLATISPSLVQYDETMNTLRYADRAKRIVNCAVVNESSNNELVFALQREIEQLKVQVREATDADRAKLMEQLTTSEAFHKELKMSLEEKLEESKRMMEVHQKHMQELEEQLEAQRGEILSLRHANEEKERRIASLLHEIKEVRSHGTGKKSTEEVDELLEELALLELTSNERLIEPAKQNDTGLKGSERGELQQKRSGSVPSQPTNENAPSVRALVKTFESMTSEPQKMKKDLSLNEFLGSELVTRYVELFEKKINEKDAKHLQQPGDDLSRTAAAIDKKPPKALFEFTEKNYVGDSHYIVAEEEQKEQNSGAADDYDCDMDLDLSVDEDEHKEEVAMRESDDYIDHDLILEDGADDPVSREFDQDICERKAEADNEKDAAEVPDQQAVQENMMLDKSQCFLELEEYIDETQYLAAKDQDSTHTTSPHMEEKDVTTTAADDADGGGGDSKTDKKKLMEGEKSAGLNSDSAYVVLPPTSRDSLKLLSVPTLVIPSHSVPNNRYLLETFKVIKKSEGVLIGSKKERIWAIDLFKRRFSNLGMDGCVSFEYPANQLLHVEKDIVNSKSLTLRFCFAPHPYDLEFTSTLRRQRFYELAVLLRQNSIMWCPSLSLEKEKDVLVNIYGTTIDISSDKAITVSGKAQFMVAPLPYEVISMWYGCFSLKDHPLPQSASVLESFLPRKSHEVYVIGVLDVLPTYIGNNVLSDYFLEHLGSSLFHVIVNTAVKSKKKTTNNAIIVIVKRPFVLRTSHLLAVEATQLFTESIAKGDFTAVGCTLRINESSIAIVLVNAKPTECSVSLRAAVLRSMISSFSFGDPYVDIGARFDYFIVSGAFNFGTDFREDDVLLAQIKSKNLMSNMVEATPPAVITNATEPLRIFYAVRQQVCRLDVKQYSASCSFAVPNAFLSMALFTQRPFLSVFEEQRLPLQLVFDDLIVTSPDNRIPDFLNPELRISAEWISNSPLRAVMSGKKNSYTLSGRAVPLVIPTNSNFEFLRLQTITFSLLGLIAETDGKNASVIASGALALKNAFQLGEFVNFSIPLYYRACFVGVLTGKLLLAAYDLSGGFAVGFEHEHNVLVVSCYENQVRDEKRWQPADFAKNCAHPFSAKDIEVECSKESYVLPDPAAWTWLGPWRHDVFPHDADGWRYGETFSQALKNVSPKCMKLSKVRRRRWMRPMQASDPFTYHNYLMSLRTS